MAGNRLVETYYKGVHGIINNHVPLCSKIITLRPEIPWYSDKHRSATNIWRKAEITMLELFRLTSEVEIKEIIIKSPNKSCDLDSLPTWLLKKCEDQPTPLITAIVNTSMDESVMPSCLKPATITPSTRR